MLLSFLWHSHSYGVVEHMLRGTHRIGDCWWGCTNGWKVHKRYWARSCGPLATYFGENFVSYIVRKWQNKVGKTTMHWPACSTKLILMEHVWGMLDRRLNGIPNVQKKWGKANNCNHKKSRGKHMLLKIFCLHFLST